MQNDTLPGASRGPAGVDGETAGLRGGQGIGALCDGRAKTVNAKIFAQGHYPWNADGEQKFTAKNPP
jgi:hypothetical protein